MNLLVRLRQYYKVNAAPPRNPHLARQTLRVTVQVAVFDHTKESNPLYCTVRYLALIFKNMLTLFLEFYVNKFIYSLWYDQHFFEKCSVTV